LPTEIVQRPKKMHEPSGAYPADITRTEIAGLAECGAIRQFLTVNDETSNCEPMSETPETTKPSTGWRSRWQIPAFAVSVLILGSGFAHLATQHKPLSFAEQCAKIDELQSANAYTRAHAYVLHLLKESERPDEERGELFRRLVGITFQVEASQRTHQRENVDTIIRSFRRAVHFGATPQGFDWYALARTYVWEERFDEAEFAFRQALGAKVAGAGGVRRELIEMLAAQKGKLSVDLVREIDLIIDDPSVTNRHYLWAVDQKVRWLLAEARFDEAGKLAAVARDRLGGSADGPAVQYLQALCQRAAGDRDTAELTIRNLLRDWTARDELWGRSMWLLGRLHLDDERPQAALTVFNDVMSSFVEGEIYDACLYGRAQALVGLGRYERSLDAFVELVGDIRSGRNSNVEGEQLYQKLADIGERVKSDERLGLAIRYLELAAALIPKDAEAERADAEIEIADAYVELAYLDDEGKRVSKPSLTFLRRAAEMYEAAAQTATNTPDLAAIALSKAAAQYDMAGMRGRVITVLRCLVDGFPARQGRAASMLSLGRALQADGRFAAAVDVFDALLSDYPRFPEALTARIPLAQCLLRVDDVAAARGVKLLTDIVDDRGATTLFTPTADEYRQALFLLADHLASGGKPARPEDAVAFERRMAVAIKRLNDAVGLYPDDPKVPQLIFLRGEAYRRTAESMAPRAVDDEDGTLRREIEQRLTRALADYQAVQTQLASVDEPTLSAVERAYLRASYLYIGDCLFDLGNTTQAIEAYQEAAWRYENDPVAVSAALQVVHGYVRLGQRNESRAALGRLRWLLEKIPAESFDQRGGMSPKSYWMDLVDRMERMGV